MTHEQAAERIAVIMSGTTVDDPREYSAKLERLIVEALLRAEARGRANAEPGCVIMSADRAAQLAANGLRLHARAAELISTLEVIASADWSFTGKPVEQVAAEALARFDDDKAAP